mgnify:CR=1 FL=1
MNNETEFVKMIKENEGLIFKITSIYGNSQEDKQDLYQEIVLQLWKSFEKFRHEAKVSTWIYRVALNTAISRLRKDKKSNETILDDKLMYSLPDNQDSILEERSKELYIQIARLNDIEKAVVLLHLENKSHNEISEITGLTVSNVGTRMARIKQKLKENIAKN